jgi:hypothetical protein
MQDTERPPTSREATPSSAGDEEAHDVLAAEAFGVPAPDPSLHRGTVVLPEDPTGIEEPHDVLAAEEFPMPAACGPGSPRALVRPEKTSHRIGIAAAAGLLLIVIRRLMTRRRVDGTRAT